jgi:hypothetical protein
MKKRNDQPPDSGSLLVALCLHAKYFHYFVPEVVDDFHGDPAGLGFVEGA